jgi:nucleoside-diphosphate-sugar epimerase
MQDKRILVAGYGKLGQRVAQQLASDHDVTALKRHPVDPAPPVRLCFADLNNPDQLAATLSEALPEGAHYLIYCLSPAERTEAGYRAAYLHGLQHLLNALPQRRALQHILFVSSTSVYHQSQGEWVDEHSACQPDSFSGKVLLEAEQYLFRQTIPATVVRFSGIYGGGRSRLIDQVRKALTSGEALEAGKGFTNRIHEDDCVGFLCHLIGLLVQGKTLASIYVASDSEPSSLAEVYAFIGEQLQAQPESNTDNRTSLNIQTNEHSARRAGSKRCCNHVMLDSGYQLKFPGYREGYLLHP